MGKVAFVFPGQGSQYVGMGSEFYREFPRVREIFHQVRDETGVDVPALCFHGPQEELDLTLHTQISVLTVDIAVYEVLREHFRTDPCVMAGHSLGEYAALYAAGSITLDEIIPLVWARARYHQDAVPPGDGAMAAIIGLKEEDVTRVCQDVCNQGGNVSVSIINTPEQIVISGYMGSVDEAMARCIDRGARRSVKLMISAPCHCNLMEGAVQKLKGDLDRTHFQNGRLPVIPNCDPTVFHTQDTTKALLLRQLTSPVKWQKTVEKMAGMGVDTLIELGPKRVLSGLVRRINGRLRLLNVEDIASLNQTLAALEV
ncbi:MAG: ACP S-malonyltransferase [Syntrophaceae bacterium]|nr:ACP S-malonyltransferase [Syntrophaceae bacterium]